MLPKYHFLFGIIFVIVLHFFFPQISFFGLSIIFLSSFLIDVDHVFYYFLKEGILNPFKAYTWAIKRTHAFHKLSRSQRKKFYSGFFLFHGIEWLIILFLLGTYVSRFFIFIFVGFSFHFIIDTIYEIYDKGTVDKISLFWNFYRFKKLKNMQKYSINT